MTDPEVREFLTARDAEDVTPYVTRDGYPGPTLWFTRQPAGRGERCWKDVRDELTWEQRQALPSGYRLVPSYSKSRCTLPAGHDGDHDQPNWHGRMVVSRADYGPGVEVDTVSSHDSRSVRVKTREQADAMLAFLAAEFDAAFNTPDDDA